jgi:hypothetical protein
MLRFISVIDTIFCRMQLQAIHMILFGTAINSFFKVLVR